MKGEQNEYSNYFNSTDLFICPISLQLTGDNHCNHNQRKGSLGDNTLPTSNGDYKLISARIVPEANGNKPTPNEKLLLVVLERTDGGQIDLAAFQTAIQEVPEGVYILGDDSSKTITTMAGWVDEDFSIGFRVPENLKTYELHWPGINPLIFELEE